MRTVSIITGSDTRHTSNHRANFADRAIARALVRYFKNGSGARFVSEELEPKSYKGRFSGSIVDRQGAPILENVTIQVE